MLCGTSVGTNFKPGQICATFSSYLIFSPLHGFPPNRGMGLLQWRNKCRLTLEPSEVQVPAQGESFHGDQAPSTRFEIYIYNFEERRLKLNTA